MARPRYLASHGKANIGCRYRANGHMPVPITKKIIIIIIIVYKHASAIVYSG
jgi:hypothetical protein